MRGTTPRGKIAWGIVCFLAAALMIVLMIILYQETSRDKMLYTVPVTGTVQNCESYQRTNPSVGRGIKYKTYYAITISYETDSAQQRTIKVLNQTRPYQNGEEVELMCNPDTNEAVRKSEIVQDPYIYIFISLFALAMIVGGVLWMKHGLQEV